MFQQGSYGELFLQIVLVGLPFCLQVGRVIAFKENGLAVGLERCPVAADDAVVGDNGLEDAAVVVGAVPVLLWEHDVAALVTDQVFIVGRNQQKLTFPETSCAAIICQVEFTAFPFLHMDAVTQ